MTILLAADWLTTAQGVISLLVGLVGLISGGVGAFFAIKNFLKALKEKNATEIWNLIMSIADKAMKEAEASSLKGADKKQMVVDAVKAGCKEAGLEIEGFIDQLNDYIDQTISFVNDMKDKK